MSASHPTTKRAHFRIIANHKNQAAIAALAILLISLACSLEFGGLATAGPQPASTPVAQATPVAPAPALPGAAVIYAYADALADGLEDWSWGTTVDLNNANPVKNGSQSVAVTFNEGWGAFFIKSLTSFDTAGYTDLSFWIHGGSSGGQTIYVQFGSDQSKKTPVTPTANQWVQVTIPLATFGSLANVSELYFQEGSGSAQPTFYLDDIALLASSSAPPPASSSNLVYADALADGWQDWSWGTTVDLNNADPVKNGSRSIAVTFNEGWSALFLKKPEALSSAGYSDLSFWIHGGSSGGQTIYVQIGNDQSKKTLVTPTANQWVQVTIPLAMFGDLAGISDVYFQEGAGAAQPTFYLDDIALVGTGASGSVPSTVVLLVDAASNQHPISDDIYGMNFANDAADSAANEAFAQEIKLPLNRLGGNAATRYNWQNDTANRASDWFFENIPNNLNNPSLPDGSFSDLFVEANRRTGSDTVLTIALIGWTPVSAEKRCGFSVSKYGPQQDSDGDCGNGVKPDGSTMITGNDPHDTSIETTPGFVQDWIKHLAAKYGSADDGGVRFYSLDNEPMLWNYTHRDVHPNPVTYDEIRDQTYLYAAAVKAVDPGAKTLGPVLWGWCAYFYSAADGCGNQGSDYTSHGNLFFLDWYLQQMNAYEQQHGVRILDYLDLHFYPQADGVDSPEAGDAATQARRLRSTRALWDPSYQDESWIPDKVMLIPRMKEWVNKNYPGTKLAISEYRWGAFSHINGALAQADILGIFGREGLDLATLWIAPAPGDAIAYAFRMYRNYDGQGGMFGDTSVHARSTNQDILAIYAAVRQSDGALTLMVINKTEAVQTTKITLANFSGSASAQVYSFSSANPQAIVRLGDQPVSDSSLPLSFEANSITLLVIPKQ